ncbi:hypothetical protein E2C01_015785 [Portunus trituberculatus]|uniref:Uncharacterized protein n=1 Tax=Portunus trituberculatus TaxID=210409 RepID=A0A5B7DMF3_PORTR|nr:hypothetical protein [Portunus trituberculatus]
MHCAVFEAELRAAVLTKGQEGWRQLRVVVVVVVVVRVVVRREKEKRGKEEGEERRDGKGKRKMER